MARLEETLIVENMIFCNDPVFGSGERKIICRTHKNPSLEQELKEVFDNIKKQFMIVQNEMYILKLFDNTLHRNCNKKLQEILDFYSNFINESVEKKKFVYHNSHNIQQYRIELISMMYNEGLKQIAKWN